MLSAPTEKGEAGLRPEPGDSTLNPTYPFPTNPQM